MKIGYFRQGRSRPERTPGRLNQNGSCCPTKVANFEDNGAQPPWTFEHEVDLSGYEGEQTVLARWTVADTTNAFYSCIDVDIS